MITIALNLNYFETIPMRIIDLNGKVIEIENLDLAISQADNYRNFEHTDKAFMDFDNKQKTYWDDVYLKLLLLADEAT